MYIRVKNELGKWVDIPALKGNKGDTPVKGLDYYTEEEKQELIEEILARIVNGNEVSR